MSNGMRRDDIDKFFDYNIHIPSRTLYMGDEVDEEMAELFLKGMALLHQLASSKTDGINIVMNNIGGDEYHGLAIYDAIATSPCHITITAYGHAMSMGSWILQAADERILSPHCTVMIHYGSWSASGEMGTVRTQYKEGERLNDMMEKVYLKRMQEADDSRITLGRLKKMLEKDTFFTASDAVARGLADKILETP